MYIKSGKKMIYDNLVKINNLQKTKFNINFVDGAFVEIKSGTKDEFLVQFINPIENKMAYEVKLKNNTWARVSKKYYVPWNIKIWKGNELVYDYNYNCEGKNVYIALESKSLGDTLAWFPILEEFRKERKCNVIVSTFHNNFFKDNYPDLKFIQPGEAANNLYAMYKVGWFYDGDNINYNMNPTNFRENPLQKTATDILGLEYKEVIPKMNLKEDVEREKQVCIAVHGTAQSKYWNREGGWQEVVDWLNNEGYKVVLLSRENDGYMGNHHPNGVHKLQEGPIDGVIEQLQKSKAFIGIGSGLSWVSWATHTPTILISGFSESYSETTTNTYRLCAEEGKCSGCFNRYKLDAGDWNWCPDHKGTDRQFECSKSISPQSVIKELKKVLN